MVGQAVGEVPGRRPAQDGTGVFIQSDYLVRVGGAGEDPMQRGNNKQPVNAVEVVHHTHHVVGRGVHLDQFARAEVGDVPGRVKAGV